MGIWQRIKSRVKEWLGGGSSKKATPPRARAIRSVSRGNTQATGYYRGGRAVSSREEEERKKKKEQYTNAFKAKKSEAKDITEAVKKPPANKPKSVVERKQAIDANRANAQKKLNDLKAKRERKVQKERTYTNADGEKVVVRETKSHRAQGKVGGTLASDTAYRMKEMPKTQSFTRGLASGLSLGATDLEAKRLAKLNKDRAEAEKTYQKKKSKGAEMAGEIAGSLATFGGTEGATRALGEKAVKGGAKVAGKVAPKTAGKIVKAVGKDRAKKIANAVAADVAQNATTGALYDFNKATAEHKIGSKEWKKEMKTSAALNLGVTGAVAGVTALKGNKRAIKEAVENVTETAAENKSSKNYLRRRLKERNTRIRRGETAADEAIESAPNEYRVGLNRKRRTDVINPIQQKQPIAVENGAMFGGDLKRGAFGQKLPSKETAKATSSAKKSAQGRTENPSELFRGYTSKGHKKKLADAETRVKSLLDAGDEAGARAEVERAVDDIARGTKITEIDETTKAIKDELRNTRISISAKDATDAGYKSGSYNEFRKKNFGSLKLTKDGASVEDVWKDLQDKYGTSLFPEEIDNPSDQLQHLAELSNAKGNEFSLPDDEAANLKGKLSDHLWESANKGREHTPFSMSDEQRLTEELAARPYEAEELAELERGTRAYGDIDAGTKATPPQPRRGTRNIPERPVEEYAAVGEAMPSTDPAQTARSEMRADLERRTDEFANGASPSNGKLPNGEPIKMKEVEEAEQTLSQGQRQAREEYFKKTGERIEGGKPATDDQILDALERYERSQGRSAERKLSKVAYSQVKISDADTAKIINDRLVANSDAMEYDVVHHAEMYEEVANDLDKDWDRWIDKLCDVAEGGDWSGQEGTKLLFMSQYLSEITDATKSPEQAALAETAWKATQKLATNAAQTMNGRRAYAHLSKASKMESALDDMVTMLDSAIGFNRKNRKAMVGLNKFEREHYIKGQLLQDTKLRDCLKKLANAKDEDAISEAYTEMLLQFNKSNPKSGFDVVQELRYLNMLGNPKTHIRNVFGSAFFSPMRQVSNAIRAGIEDTIAKNAGLEITKHGGISLTAAKEARVKNPTTEAGKAAQEAFERLKKDILGSAKYDTPKYSGRGKTIIGKMVDKLSDFNSALLAGEDDFFRSRAFKENYIKTYNRYLKDKKPITDKVKRLIEAEAIKESQIATFNEYNEFAKFLNNITRKANDANATVGARWAGRGVNAMMPFTKVPANLMKQSVNYSPLGIARGLANIKNAAKKGDAELLNAAIDQLSSGITGTGVFALGMLLGKTTDMFTTNAGKNDPAAKFKKGQGVQNYSVTFKDPVSGETHSYTLDWLVPASATFFSGVEMANQLKAGDFNILDIGGDWSTVVTRLAEPVMETSMLSGLHGMLETMRSGSNDDDTKSAIGILGRELVQSYLNSLVPTMAGQASRTAYKTDMQLAGDDDWEYWRSQIKSKAGLANTKILGEELGADTDLYGNVKGEKKNVGDYVAAGVKNFLSPANIQKVDISEVDKQKLAEYERRVKAGENPDDLAYLFPKKQYNKKFTVGNTDIKMSNRQLSAYNQAKTTGGEEGMRYILENLMFNRYEKGSDGEKHLVDGYTKEEKAKLMKQFKGKSMREVEKWLHEQPQFKNATEAEKRKAINGLWTLSSQGKANASKRVGEQAVYKAQGKDVNEYNFNNELSEKKRKNLQPYIDSGVLTYEEAVDFARNAGKTYYYENDEGGSAQTYFNKKQMIEYLVGKGYSYEKAEALFNSFKASNAKPYSGNSLSSGRGRRGRRYGGGYHRRRGGGSKIKAVKKSAFKAKSYKSSYKDITSSLKTRSGSSKSTASTVKIEPPKVKFKKYEV